MLEAKANHRRFIVHKSIHSVVCICVCACLFSSSSPGLYFSPFPLKRTHYAIPVFLFWGIAKVESDYDPLAVGEDGHDKGMWQFRDLYNEERRLINPFDPVESTEKAIVLFTSNLDYFCDVERAISAHKRGRRWVSIHGVDEEYVSLVKGER